MCRIEIALKSLENSTDLEKTRSLLRQADACATCPEQAHTAVGADECSCRVRFRTELQNSLRSFFGGS
ncbi:MAG: hypothetical protein CVU57_05685 [Deltaproteobacteria bacterium HGW-Deltaproteobacteria-15]|jgi:hypothetical protein|nr:MAG: hypothetical protein CVU57_05685 [Deltaproteobacteria bacterium HGW-Deltaproteobacteria-15]